MADSGAAVLVDVEADADVEYDPLAENDYTTMTKYRLKPSL